MGDVPVAKNLFSLAGLGKDAFLGSAHGDNINPDGGPVGLVGKPLTVLTAQILKNKADLE